MISIRTKKIIKRTVLGGILLGVVLPSCFIATKKVIIAGKASINDFFTPRSVAIALQGPLSVQAQEAIRSYVYTQVSDASLLQSSLEDITAKLHETFPIIKAITTRLDAARCLHIQIKSVTPHCLINTTHVLGDKNYLFGPSDFEAQALAGLPTIHAPPKKLANDKLPATFYTIIKNLTPYHWACYNITYNNPWNITLAPRASRTFFYFIADKKTLFDTAKQQAVPGLLNYLAKNNYLTEKIITSKWPMMAFDLRMNGRIITRFLRGYRRGRGT